MNQGPFLAGYVGCEGVEVWHVAFNIEASLFRVTEMYSQWEESPDSNNNKSNRGQNVDTV